MVCYLLLSRRERLSEFDVLNVGRIWHKSDLGIKDVLYIKVDCCNLFKFRMAINLHVLKMYRQVRNYSSSERIELFIVVFIDGLL